MTLTVELNKSGSSWPMNRTAEETNKKEQPITLLYERGNSIQWILKVPNTVKYIPCSTNGRISESISYVFSGQLLWCCQSLYCIDLSPLMTLAVELNKSGSSWPMNRTAEETCEKEQPITLLYERGNSIRLILKVQNTVKYIPCSTNGPISPSISDIFFWDFCDVVDLFTIEDRVPFWP